MLKKHNKHINNNGRNKPIKNEKNYINDKSEKL